MRITAQRLENGRIEFGLQQRETNGSWGERELPRRRYFPANSEVDRWLNSTPVTITVDVPVISATEEEELTPDLPDVATDSEVGKTRSNPIPLGSSVRVGNVQVQVLGIVPDGRDLGFSESDPTEQSYLVDIQVTYLGAEASTIQGAIRIGLQDPSRSLERPFVHSLSSGICHRVSGTLDEWAEVFADRTIAGTMCYAIQTVDADLGQHVLVVSSESEQPVFLAVAPNTGDITGPGKSPSRPVPYGQAAKVGEWSVEVLATPTDLTAKLVPSGYSVYEVPAGWQINGVEVLFTYTGTTSSSMAIDDLQIGGFSRDGMLYPSILTGGWWQGLSCGDSPLVLDISHTRLFYGATMRGYLCFKTTAAKVAGGGLVLLIDSGPERVFMALE